MDVFKSPKIYYFTVKDCFKNPKYRGIVLKDSVKPSNVMMGHRVWRTINLEVKENKIIFTQNNQCQQIGLFEVIKFGLFEKKLNAFYSDDFNEAAKNRIAPQQLNNLLAVKDTIRETVFDAQGNETVDTRIENRYYYNSDIRAYLLKEDWFMDSYSGKLEKKIIAFAPLIVDRKSGKTVPLFWLYYNEWKELLLSFEAKNLVTDGVISYRTLLEKNYFISVISKESNISDRSVKDYEHGQDTQLESETIKEKIYNSERDQFPR